MRMYALVSIVLLAVLLLAPGVAPVAAAPSSGAAPPIAWQQLLGGNLTDTGYVVQQTADGGTILIGSSDSSASGDVTGTNHGVWTSDLWVVKLNRAGAIAWQRLLGGSGQEFGYAVQQTLDGGYILLGVSTSSNSGDVAATNHGGADIWLVKLDPVGAIQWQRLLGGGAAEDGRSVQQTVDGGYLLLGTSDSSMSGDVAGMNHGSPDLWVVKLDTTGAIQWQKLLGGSNFEQGRSLQQTTDGGSVLLGSSWSSTSGDVAGANHGTHDLWVVKLDAAGSIQWQRLLGGGGSDDGGSVQQTDDGGYVLLGDSDSSASGDVTSTNHGQTDLWIVKLDGAGATSWQRLLGGTYVEGGGSVRQTSDGGYVLLGSSASSASGDVTGTSHGGSDLWVVKLDGAGAISWQKLLGGDRGESGYSVRQTADGGYVLLGTSTSSASGDVTGTNHDIHYSPDCWVVRLEGTAPAPTPTAVEAYEVVTAWGTSGTGPAQFQDPGGIAVDPAGNVYVADSGNNRVQKFDPNGTFLSQVGGIGGIGPGQFMGPGGLAVDGAGNLYVADTGNNRVQTFTPDLTFLSQIGGLGGALGQMFGPRGLAVDNASNVYVADTGNNRVQRFASNLTFLPPIGGLGGAIGQMLGPQGVAVDGTGNVYVADTGNNRVQKFRKDGTCDGQIGELGGTGDGQLYGPRGVAVDGRGNVYVADTGNDRVQKFNSTGDLVALIGAPGDASSASSTRAAGTEDGGLRGPWSIAIDSAGNLYVADSGNNRVQVLAPLSPVPAAIRVPGGSGVPTDTNADGKYDDVNGNGRQDFADVVLYFNQMTWIAGNEPAGLFDYNGNGRIDFADVVWLFNHL